MFLISFRGRIRRPAFVLWYVVALALAYAFFIVALLLALGPCPASASGAPSEVVLSFAIPACLAVLWSTTFAARRLHDCGWSGWWALVLVVAPALSIFAGIILGESARGTVMSVLPAVVQSVELVAFLVLAFWNGTAGDNRFGPPPRSSWSLRAVPPQTA